jgi:hypothetical protein
MQQVANENKAALRAREQIIEKRERELFEKLLRMSDEASKRADVARSQLMQELAADRAEFKKEMALERAALKEEREDLKQERAQFMKERDRLLTENSALRMELTCTAAIVNRLSL